ncbi:MAG: hypothetical protein NVS4B2_11500 [Chloroflexota bacterium]
MTQSHLTIRPRRPEDDPRLVEIDRLNDPDGPSLSIEELRHEIETDPPEAQTTRLVAEVDGEVVGEVAWSRKVYVENQNAWWSQLSVDPGRQNRGTGTELFRVMLTGVQNRGAAKVVCSVREDRPRSIRFLETRGFSPTGRATRLSALDVAGARLERCREAARQVEKHNIRIATMAEIGLENLEFLHALHRMSDDSERDMPRTESYAGMPFDAWYRDMFETTGTSLDAFWVALDDDLPVGLVVLTTRQGGWADNHYTGVARSHRGRGIARALKYHTVEWAQQHGIQSIITGNDATNKPMLAINIDLGYQPLAARIEMARDLSAR